MSVNRMPIMHNCLMDYTDKEIVPNFNPACICASALKENMVNRLHMVFSYMKATTAREKLKILLPLRNLHENDYFDS